MIIEGANATGNDPKMVALLGFGNADVTKKNIATGRITIENNSSQFNGVFIMPREGRLSNITAYVVPTGNVRLKSGETLTITAILYQPISPTSNVFESSGVSVDIVTFTSSSQPQQGVVYINNKAFNLDLDLGDRLLMVFEATATGNNSTINFSCHAGASIAIS